MDELTIEFQQASAPGVAQFSRPADDQVEHRLRIARRGRHRLEHIDRGGLMFDALAEFAVARGQIGAARVELALEFRDRPLGIDCRLVERRAHLLASSGSTLVRGRQMLTLMPPSPPRGSEIASLRSQ
jgi:hypothetical protein